MRVKNCLLGLLMGRNVGYCIWLILYWGSVYCKLACTLGVNAKLPIWSSMPLLASKRITNSNLHLYPVKRKCLYTIGIKLPITDTKFGVILLKFPFYQPQPPPQLGNLMFVEVWLFHGILLFSIGHCITVCIFILVDIHALLVIIMPSEGNMTLVKAALFELCIKLMLLELRENMW